MYLRCVRNYNSAQKEPVVLKREQSTLYCILLLSLHNMLKFISHSYSGGLKHCFYHALFNYIHMFTEVVIKITVSSLKILLLSGTWPELSKGGSPADTNNYDRFDAPIPLNTREV